MTPLINNHTLRPSLINPTFIQWYNSGIHTLKDLYIKKLFPSFQQLQEKFNLHNRDFFKYLQIRSFVMKTFPSFPHEPPESIMETLLQSDPLTKGSISRIHNTLFQIDCTATLDHLKEAWQEDLGVEISDNQWTKAQDNVHSSSVC